MERINDNRMDILLNMKYPDIIHLCQTNKEYKQYCNRNYLWQKMIARDFPMWPEDKPDAKILYETGYNLVDRYTIRIIAAFIVYKTKIIYLQHVYDTIFKILIHYMNVGHNIDLTNDNTLQNKLELDIINNIFKILTVPFHRFDPQKLPMPNSYLINKADVNKLKYILHILYEFHEEFVDIY